MLTDNNMLLLVSNGKIFSGDKNLLCRKSHYIRMECEKQLKLHKSEQKHHLFLPNLIPPEFVSMWLNSLQSPLGIYPLLSRENVHQVILYAQILRIQDIQDQCKEFLNSPVMFSQFESYIWSQYWSHITNPALAYFPQTFPKVKRPPVVIISKEEDRVKGEEIEENIDVVNDDGTEDKTEQEESISVQDMLPKMKPHENIPRLEVASCDGPVQFHRVINKYLKTNKIEDDIDECSSDSNSTATNSEIFRCYFCNHVFKSKYCYQKHKKRHLNPITVDEMLEKPNAKTLPQYFATKQCQHEEESNHATGTILKDNNVQFFPCKICGAKFPSYYFVHKHKKMWHAEQMAKEEAATTSKVTPTASAEPTTSPSASATS